MSAIIDLSVSDKGSDKGTVLLSEVTRGRFSCHIRYRKEIEMKAKKLIVVALIMSLIMCLCACGGRGIGSSPKKTADTFLKAIKNQDKETLEEVYESKFLGLLEEAAESEDFEEELEDAGLEDAFETILVKKMLEFDYKLSNEQIDGDYASVDATIKTYAVGEAVTSFLSEYFTRALGLALGDASNADYEYLAAELLEKELKKLSKKDYESTVTLYLTKIDDRWIVNEITPGDGVMDALTGGLMSAFGGFYDLFMNFGY